MRYYTRNSVVTPSGAGANKGIPGRGRAFARTSSDGRPRDRGSVTDARERSHYAHHELEWAGRHHSMTKLRAAATRLKKRRTRARVAPRLQFTATETRAHGSDTTQMARVPSCHAARDCPPQLPRSSIAPPEVSSDHGVRRTYARTRGSLQLGARMPAVRVSPDPSSLVMSSPWRSPATGFGSHGRFCPWREEGLRLYTALTGLWSRRARGPTTLLDRARSRLTRAREREGQTGDRRPGAAYALGPRSSVTSGFSGGGRPLRASARNRRAGPRASPSVIAELDGPSKAAALCVTPEFASRHRRGAASSDDTGGRGYPARSPRTAPGTPLVLGLQRALDGILGARTWRER
jgi:hypothetical protein